MGVLVEKYGLPDPLVKLCGLFPSSSVSPELLGLVSHGADRVSRQASGIAVVISRKTRGCNLCQAT